MFRTTPLRIAALAVIAALVTSVAHAQVRQSGSVTTGHAASWATNGVIQDAGTAGNGALNALGITATGTPLCINDSASSGSYHQLCLGANSLGGGLLSYNAYGGASNLPFQININGSTTTLGTGTVNSATSGSMAYYATTGTAVSGAPNIQISDATMLLGSAGFTAGTLELAGGTSGVVSVAASATAGGYTFTLPSTAGTSGQVLTSSGGSGSLTWTTSGGSVVAGTTGQTAYYTGNAASVSGTSALILTTTTAALSPSGVLTINPATLSTMNNVTIGGSTPAAATFTTASATGQVASGVSGSSIGSYALSGNSSGTILIKPQAASGTYNFNMPITAGSSGFPLLSGGGGASPMTWGSLSGNTSTFATTTGSLTSGHVATFDASGNLQDGGAPNTGVINSGTAGQMTYYAGTGTTLSGNANATISSGAMTLGVTGAAAGSVILAGSSTGAVTIKGSTTTVGTFNFNLPTTAGTANGPLLSGGGGATAMSWGTISGTTTKFGTVTGSLTNGNCLAADASGNLIDNGSPCGTGGSGTVTSGTATQLAYYASSTNAVASNSALTVVGGALTLGVPTTTQGQLKLSGSTTGTITITGQAAAGTYEFDLPTTAGSAGQVLTSAGGAGSPMTWGSAGLASISVQTTSFSASSNASYCVDTTGGAVTVTLPGSPSNNDQILLLDCTSNFAVANMIVGRNAKKIMGLSADMTVTNTNAAFHLIYVSANGDWRIF